MQTNDKARAETNPSSQPFHSQPATVYNPPDPGHLAGVQQLATQPTPEVVVMVLDPRRMPQTAAAKDEIPSDRWGKDHSRLPQTIAAATVRSEDSVEHLRLPWVQSDNNLFKKWLAPPSTKPSRQSQIDSVPENSDSRQTTSPAFFKKLSTQGRVRKRANFELLPDATALRFLEVKSGKLRELDHHNRQFRAPNPDTPLPHYLFTQGGPSAHQHVQRRQQLRMEDRLSETISSRGDVVVVYRDFLFPPPTGPKTLRTWQPSIRKSRLTGRSPSPPPPPPPPTEPRAMRFHYNNRKRSWDA